MSTNYTGYADDALGIFLTNLLESIKEFFLKILVEIIIDFAEGWMVRKDTLLELVHL